VLVGGGLQNALVALALLSRDPAARVLMIERSPELGGNHLWSFHADDVPSAARAVVDPLVCARWPSYDVAFPGFERRVPAPYASVSSARLDAVVRRAFSRAPYGRLRTGVGASRIEADAVELSDGTRVRGEVVVDARGPARFALGGAVAWQKFLGCELAVAGALRETPLLMDARAEQRDGFRFFYVLPLAPGRVLIEDTYFSDRPELDPERSRHDVLRYARSLGLRVIAIEREETGCLPLPLAFPRQRAANGPLAAGYQGGWFHPTTGYSFPAALRLALHVAATPPHELFGAAFQKLLAEQERQVRFGVLLNRMLFGAFQPAERWRALERFYRLPEATIRRFYAQSTTPLDRLRIVCGRPPAGLSLRALLEKPGPAWWRSNTHAGAEA
jgi:lycopene beta-cyclase